MLFLPISFLLVVLAVVLSWVNKSERPFRANWLPITLLVGQALVLYRLIDLQRSIGCPTMLGECYVQHPDLDLLHFIKMGFTFSSWGYWLYLLILISSRAFKWIKRELV